LFKISKDLSVAFQEEAADKGTCGCITFITVHASIESIQSLLFQSSSELCKAILLPNDLPHILRGARINLNHAVAPSYQCVLQGNAAQSQRAHWAERDRKEPDAALQSFSVARPKMFSVPVFERFPSGRKVQRRIDADETGLRLCNIIQNLFVSVDRGPFRYGHPLQYADASVALRIAGKVDSNDCTLFPIHQDIRLPNRVTRIAF
jgi:hypothetical protein